MRASLKIPTEEEHTGAFSGTCTAMHIRRNDKELKYATRQGGEINRATVIGMENTEAFRKHAFEEYLMTW
jgi:hypothetical protein